MQTHAVEALLPDGELEFAGHDMHEELPAAVVYVPVAHSEHVSLRVQNVHPVPTGVKVAAALL